MVFKTSLLGMEIESWHNNGRLDKSSYVKDPNKILVHNFFFLVLGPGTIYFEGLKVGRKVDRKVLSERGWKLRGSVCQLSKPRDFKW